MVFFPPTFNHYQLILHYEGVQTMKKNRSKKPNNQIEHNTANLRKVFKYISTSILVLSLGMAVFLPFRQPAVDLALAAPVPGVPIDTVTLVDVWETSEFQTPNDPTDDSIEYWPDVPYLGSGTDSFTYQICDSDTDCDIATVNIAVNPVTLATTIDSIQVLMPNAGLGTPDAVDDNATVVETRWVNIDVLDNDDFGLDGPGTDPITIFPDCSSCTGPTYGTARVNEGPRSPDPTGLAYLDGHTFPDFTDRLLISDSEVNEIYPPNPAAFTGDNLFVTNLSGALVKTLTTLFVPDPDSPVYTDEPTGVAYNPANDHLFFTDDRRDRIFEVDPGPYGDYDSIVSDFKCSWIGCGDPSGVTFDTLRGHLIIVEGRYHFDQGEKVYDIDLGSNGTLDREDAWTSFDTTSIGIPDPEGIEFNPDNGHLYILSSEWDGYMAETTIDGKLLRYLDTPAVSGLDTPAGLAYIPQANGSDTNTIYIVDRGDDNDPPTVPLAGPVLLAGDPMENDGKLFKVTIPRNAPPFVDAGPNQTITFLTDATLDGTVIDDGWPESPGTVTTSWSAVSGPGLVTFGDASAVDTTASFDTLGTYVLNLEADDGGAHLVNDQVTIQVDPPVNQAPIVDAGSNQTITFPDSAILNGIVTDDGWPNPPGSFTTEWSTVSGPDQVSFDDDSKPNTTASFPQAGVYVLRLTANDSEYIVYDDVTITVNLTKVWLPLILK